jgi:antitoxin CcdA
MRMKHTRKAARRATNVTLPVDLVEAAKAEGINISEACTAGLAASVKAERERKWRAENADAIAATNAWVREHGLPLEKYRLF